jgi:uncharacterized protein (DUF736 family)
MPEYDNTNSGALFQNDRKEKPNHPDFKGSINVAGVEYWLSGWQKTGKKGSFVSLSVQLKDTAGDKPAGSFLKADKPVSEAPAFDDTIPF